MHPYTIVQTPQAGILTLVVPHEFDGKRLVVTITEEASDPALQANPNADLLNVLLSAPTLSEEELQGFADARAHIHHLR